VLYGCYGCYGFCQIFKVLAAQDPTLEAMKSEKSWLHDDFMTQYSQYSGHVMTRPMPSLSSGQSWRCSKDPKEKPSLTWQGSNTLR
jgi:hypothetical protein